MDFVCDVVHRGPDLSMVHLRPKFLGDTSLNEVREEFRLLFGPLCGVAIRVPEIAADIAKLRQLLA